MAGPTPPSQPFHPIGSLKSTSKMPTLTPASQHLVLLLGVLLTLDHSSNVPLISEASALRLIQMGRFSSQIQMKYSERHQPYVFAANPIRQYIELENDKQPGSGITFTPLFVTCTPRFLITKFYITTHSRELSS